MCKSFFFFFIRTHVIEEKKKYDVVGVVCDQTTLVYPVLVLEKTKKYTLCFSKKKFN